MTEQFKILGEQTIEPAGHSAMRIVDLEDREPPILPKNCLMNTINLNKQVSHVSGTCSILMKRATMTIIADTCGVHDMLTAACSSFTNEKRYGVKNNRKLPHQSGRSAEVVGHCLERCPPLNINMNCRSNSAQEQGQRPHRLSRRNGHNRGVIQLPADPQRLHAFRLKPMKAVICGCEYSPY